MLIDAHDLLASRITVHPSCCISTPSFTRKPSRFVVGSPGRCNEPYMLRLYHYDVIKRSAAYAARWVAKSLVKAGLCRRCLVQLSYAIGIAEPISITVFPYGTSTKPQKELLKIINANFDLRPGMIMKELDLARPIYLKTSAYGHFGRNEFPWEVPKKLVF